MQHVCILNSIMYMLRTNCKNLIMIQLQTNKDESNFIKFYFVYLYMYSHLLKLNKMCHHLHSSIVKF